MLNKLFLSSLVLFFPADMRLPAGMVWSVGFIILLLLLQPYVRATDGKLSWLPSVITSSDCPYTVQI